MTVADPTVGSHAGSPLATIRGLLPALAPAERRVAERVLVDPGAAATTVAITNHPRSPLASAAEHVLVTAARETTFRSGATASRIAQLTIVECLFVAVAQRTYDATLDALVRTREAVRGRRRGEGSRP